MTPCSAPSPAPSRGEPYLALRRVLPADQPRLAALLRALSERTRRLRYTLAQPVDDAFVDREVQRMSAGQSERALTLVATVKGTEREEVIAVAELVRDARRPQTAEFALVVRDDWQARGVGTALLRRLVAAARVWELATLEADTVAENHGVFRLLRRLQMPFTPQIRYGEAHITLRLRDDPFKP